MNVYDNYVKADQAWNEVGGNKRRALAYAERDNIIEGRVVLLGDLNAYGLKWNIQSGERREAA